MKHEAFPISLPYLVSDWSFISAHLVLGWLLSAPTLFSVGQGQGQDIRRTWGGGDDQRWWGAADESTAMWLSTNTGLQLDTSQQRGGRQSCCF